MEGGQSLLLILMVGLCFHSITAQRTVCTQEGVADIVFMVDGSWSIGTKNFEQIRQFLYTLVNSFDVGPDRVRIGLVQYSTTPRTEFLLNTYQNKSDILDYISKLPYMGGGTETGQGLDFMMREHFIDAAGSRAKQNVPQIAVVITDGKSQDNVESHANELKKKGIVIYAIGIKEADEEQLREIANLPHSQHVYSVSDFTALQGISLSVVQTLCTTVEEAKRQLLQLSTECAAATKADIVFLVDGSSSIGSKNFADAQNFLRSAVEGLDIGPDKVRIGLAQYSDEPHKEFLLKDHMDKQSLLTQISSFPYLTGGTQTGEAIKFINQTYFTEEAGSRANQRVPQIAVVITDGDSTDDVIEPAKSLREKGVMVFAIGVGQANVKELQSMANKPSEHFVFHLDNYQALLAKKDELLQTVCVSMEDQRQALAEKFSDIFFLLDGGLSSTEFGQVRNILVRLSNQLKVGASAHRLGLAFYGQDTRVEFFLNSYQTKEDIQSKIKKVRIGQLQPNEKRNLGNALEQARTRFLIKEAGSRADQGYQQYLVVFSGQDSNDDVDRFSHLIKSEGVTVAGVSLGVSSSQMKDISTPGYYFQSNTNLVPSLKSVFEGQEQAFSQTQDCRAAFLADIVFIVDESGSIGTKNFQLVRTFLHTVISGIEVGSNRVRLGIVTYSAKATAHVYLDSFDNKKDLLNFVKILPYRKGGTQTGAALNFTRENVFVKNRGSRKDKGVQQVAVVITDGKSDDDVSRAAAELRRTGVTIYSVGIKNATKEELVKIVSHPPNKHIFMVNDFTKLRSVEQTLQKILCQDIVHQAITVQTRRTNIKEECLQTDEADIFFLIDQSGSIHPPDFYDMKKFIFEFLNNFRIGPQHIRVGIVKYADDPVLEFDLTTYSDVKTMKKAVEDMLQVGGGTETGKAITFMGPQFDRAEVTRGYKVSEYLVVITDGQSTDDVKVPAKKLQSQGVTVYAIGVQNADQEQLREIAGDPKRTFFVNDFDALNPIKDNIITDICSTDACKDIPGDLVFLIDSSGSIDSLDYEKMKEFMKTIISRSAIGIDDVHIGVMQYSTKPRLEFSLSFTYNKDEMNTAVDKMQQIGGGTHTGQAITAVSQLFDGGRSKLRQRLVVITDGESQDAVAAPAEALRAKGVAIYAIGVVNANTTQLLEISGSSDKMYSGRDFDALKDLENQISLDLCAKEGECRKTQQADVIFLVDGSTSISLPKFRSMQKFMSAMVNQTTVGKDLTRFGVILYSTYPKNNFTLETYGSKKEVLQAIQDLTPPRGDTYTGLALEYSLDFFSAANGGRAALKVPQVLMVITDGEATDPHHLEKPSMALRNNGISVFSIGVEEANKKELEIMAGHDASKIFYVDNFDALETLYKNLSLVLCNSTKPVCEKQKADLVFLLDQSGSITTNDYTIMKKFTTDLIKSFKVGEDLVRVGLAQFSDTFQHEFYLDKFYSEQEVTKHIMGTVQTGGGTKIGKALDSIRDYFQASRGGRRSSGISQNLVLITDGDSQDEVLAAAERLRALKVEVFVIGIGHVQVMELLQITGTPDRLFTVQNFGSLEKIKDKVVDTICKSKPIENPSGCTIDVAMGFDISRRSGTPGEMLVSGHTKLQALLPEIGHYASSVSELCCSKPDLIRTNVGYRVVGRNGQQIDDFKFEAYSEEVLRKVMTLNLKEPTYFNSALLKSFGQKFKAESGAGVKVLIIFSDGLDEDVMRLEQESELLRKSNINALLVVALEGARNPAELQMVEFGRGFGYKLPLSIGMPSVGSTILKQIDAVSNRECCSVMCKCSGHEGVHGSRGHPGSKGVTGQKGYPGFPGEEGVAGERGFPGPSGPQGLQGCAGNRGTKGNRGLRGNRGDDGEDGLDGVNGEQGMTGKDGVGGERGRRGDPGIPGIRGEAGLKGQRGLRGDPGEPGADKNSPGAKGESGNPGLPGPPGSNGQPGESGVVGNQGPDGRRGAAGEKGAVGPPGDKGQPGIDGPSGSRGPQGIRGQPGPKGIFGLPGPQGAPGAPGEVGGAGRRGAVGQKGQPGDPGVQGGPGQQGARGPPGQDGRDGYGPPGAKGAKGDHGFPGYPGLVGETGPDGSKGFPGPKGNRGRNGNSGPSGETGLPGAGGNPGHTGSRGPPGVRGMTECQLITYIRDNCACSFDRTDCPAFPTELVIGLDMSEDVAPAVFERQRSAALALLEDVGIAESNCPTGARVAVVGYSAYTRYLVRFQDYRHKKQLIEFVKNIAPERTSNQRHLAAAMRFVAHNVFKRVRSGMMMRKVAVFFSSGPSQDVSDLVTAVMEYRGLNIVPAIVSTRNAPGMRKAMELDDSGNSIFTVLGRDMAADLRKVKNCAICYDPCRRSEECGFIQGTAPPQDVDVDLAMVVDSSREVQGDQYTGFQELLGSIVEQLAVSSQPRRAGTQARVAVVQQSGTKTPKVEFSLQTYQDQQVMRTHLLQKMHQLGGASYLGLTLNYTLTEVLKKATNARRKKLLLVVVGTQTAHEDHALLQYVSNKVKCEGVAVFVLTVGDRYSRVQVEELASVPVHQHLIHLDRLKAEEQTYTQRFFRVFLNALNRGVNTYSTASIKQACERVEAQEREQSSTFSQSQVGQWAELETVMAEEPREQFQQQTRGRTQTGQIDVMDTLLPGDAGFSVSGDAGFSVSGVNDAEQFLSRTVENNFPSKEACFLRQDPGGCQSYNMMWFFDPEQSECSRFWYGGCGGNGNRFTTQDECESLCLSKSR